MSEGKTSLTVADGVPIANFDLPSNFTIRKTVGTCNLCLGPEDVDVTVYGNSNSAELNHFPEHSLLKCRHCGRTAGQPYYGPLINMNP